MKSILVLLPSIGVLGAEQIQFLTLKDATDDWEIVKVATAKDRTQTTRITFTIRNRTKKTLKVGGAKGQANANLSFGPGTLLIAEECHLPHTNVTIEPGASIDATVVWFGDGLDQGSVRLVIFVEGKRVSLGTLADLTKNGQQGGADQPATAAESKAK